MSTINLKKSGSTLPIKTFESMDGKNTYLVFRQSDGSYHVFVEVEAKGAAINCGSNLDHSEITRKHWDKLWEES